MIDIDFFRCDNHLIDDDLTVAYMKLLHKSANLSRQIDNQKKVIVGQKEKIKNLSRQINFLNKAIWKYKHEKNS